MDCPFCTIDEVKTRVLKEGKHAKVLLSNPRLMPGHLLVVPHRHVEKLSELNDEEKKELVDMVIDFQEKILLKFAKGCDIRQNYRPFQKQGRLKVHHLHIHLQPREFEDELYRKSQTFETGIFSDLTGEDIEKYRNLFN